MTQLSSRKRFQIHLSTAIVLMFVAGGILWANCDASRVRKFETEDMDTTEQHAEAGRHGMLLHRYRHVERYTDNYGWPCEAVAIKEKRPTQFIYKYLILDGLIAAVIIFETWYFSELLIRRRAARRVA